MTDPICRNCGQPKSDHCEFDPVLMPDGCVCDPMTYGYDTGVGPICAEYDQGTTVNGYCVKCEHDRACHKDRKEQS